MNLQEVSKKMLEDAVTKGVIYLEHGEVRELTPSQILQVAKFIYKEGIFSEAQEEEVVYLPTEMLS